MKSKLLAHTDTLKLTALQSYIDSHSHRFTHTHTHTLSLFHSQYIYFLSLFLYMHTLSTLIHFIKITAMLTGLVGSIVVDDDRFASRASDGALETGGDVLESLGECAVADVFAVEVVDFSAACEGAEEGTFAFGGDCRAEPTEAVEDFLERDDWES